MTEHPDFPKAKYRLAQNENEADLKPTTGKHSYVSIIAATPEDEALLGSDWHDFPDMTDRKKVFVPTPEPLVPEAPAEVKRGPGRPPKPKEE